MNLASRCRQALNHVEALRKELSKYQQQEINSQQQSRPQQQSNYSVDVAGITMKDEDRVFGRTLASPNFAPQDNLEIQASSMRGGKINNSINSKSNNEHTQLPMVEEPEKILQKSVNSASKRVDTDRPYNLARENENHDVVEKAAMQRILSTPSPVTPDTDEETASPPDDSGGDFDHEISEDVVGFGELQSGDYFHQSYQTSLPATPEKENIDVDALNNDFGSFGISNEETEGLGDTNSAVGIDAFDASFQTTFPSSFADNVSPSHFGTSEFSDSFFMETTLTPGSGKKKKRPTNNESHIDPAIDTFSDEMDAPMDEAMELFPSSAMGAFETFDTPPSKSPNTVSNRSGTISSARARFERRNRKHSDSPADAPMDEAEADSAEHSPTLVLKRLQQRKAKGGLPSPNPKAKSSISITEEILKLDAMVATGTTGASLTSSREKQPRRSVSTPTSYAEPSLKSKLRRGDVYFPKDKSVSPHKLPKPVAEEGTGIVDWQPAQSSATSSAS